MQFCYIDKKSILNSLLSWNIALYTLFFKFWTANPKKKINSLGSEFLLTAKSILACLDPLK